MIIGFTGTRYGMTEQQIKKVTPCLIQHMPRMVLHGSCVGADAQFDEIARQLTIRRRAYPASNIPDQLIADLDCEEVHAPKPALDRNRLIVAECGLLIACPAQAKEQARSGTWTTVRYADKAKKQVILILPNGRVEPRGMDKFNPELE